MDALTSEDARRVDQVVALLRASRSLLVITGAGLSADSGLPTYRGASGLYKGRNADEGVTRGVARARGGGCGEEAEPRVTASAARLPVRRLCLGRTPS
jgi:hypothetical protein